MRQVIITIVCFMIACCDFKSARDYFHEAEKLEEQEKYHEAIIFLDKAIERDKKFVPAYIGRGVDKSFLGDYRGAIADYEKVLEIENEHTLAYFNIGNNYKRLDEYGKAVEYYNKAFDTKGGQHIYLDYSPNDFTGTGYSDVEGVAIHYERGIAYYFLDSLKIAYDDFYAYLKKGYMLPESHFWIGHIYLKAGQNDLACKSFTKSKAFGDENAMDALKEYCSE